MKERDNNITVFGKLIAHTQQCFHGFNSWQVEQEPVPLFPNLEKKKIKFV